MTHLTHTHTSFSFPSPSQLILCPDSDSEFYVADKTTLITYDRGTGADAALGVVGRSPKDHFFELSFVLLSGAPSWQYELHGGVCVLGYLVLWTETGVYVFKRATATNTPEYVTGPLSLDWDPFMPDSVSDDHLLVGLDMLEFGELGSNDPVVVAQWWVLDIASPKSSSSSDSRSCRSSSGRTGDSGAYGNASNRRSTRCRRRGTSDGVVVEVEVEEEEEEGESNTL